MANKLHILSVMSELGAGTRGASLGFDALKLASFKYDLKFFKRYPFKRVKTENDRLFKKDIKKYAKRLDGIEKMYRNIEKDVAQQLKNNFFPVVISGDHSNAGGTIMGIKTAFPRKRLGVIWIDAHADAHSPYTSPSGNVHGMPLATALNEDNLECAGRQPSEEVIWHWNEIKGSNQRLKPSDLFYIGVRDMEEPEKHLLKKYNIPNIPTEELRKRGVKDVAKQALEYLENCDILYISFDVDSMDPSVSKGTGTPVPNGLWEDEARELLLELVEDKRICCFEMTEINPLLDDKGNSMAETAFRILKPVVEKLEKKVNSKNK